MHRMTVEYYAPTDPADFDKRYVEGHVPLVRKIPGLTSFLLTRPRGLGTDAPYLVAELWFPDADALRAAERSPEMAAAAEDAATLEIGSRLMFSGEVVEALR